MCFHAALSLHFLERVELLLGALVLVIHEAVVHLGRALDVRVVGRDGSDKGPHFPFGASLFAAEPSVAQVDVDVVAEYCLSPSELEPAAVKQNQVAVGTFAKSRRSRLFGF